MYVIADINQIQIPPASDHDDIVMDGERLRRTAASLQVVARGLPFAEFVVITDRSDFDSVEMDCVGSDLCDSRHRDQRSSLFGLYCEESVV